MKPADPKLRRAAKLLEWLHAWPADRPLPSAAFIGRLLDFPQGRPAGSRAWATCNAFDKLERDGMIQQRTGSRSLHRGHRIVQLLDGKVLQTAGCPLTLADERADV